MKNTLFTSISKNFPIREGGGRSWWPIIGVAVLVLGLFFSKEVISLFNGTFTNSDRGEVVARNVEPVNLSPLQQVRLMLDQGALDGGTQDVIVNETGVVGTVENKDADKAFRELLGKRASRQVLMLARKNAQILFRKIRSQYPDASYEVANFISGLQVLSSAKRKTLDVPDLRRYIESLHFAVTRALINSKADRAAFMDWRQVRLDPLVNTARSAAAMNGPRLIFRPTITVTEVQFKRRSRGGIARLDFKGFVTGRDVVRMALLRNGVYVRQISKTKPVFEGNAKFSVSISDASGMYTVRAYDVEGNKFDKNYMFEGAGRSSIAAKGPDPRVDGYFAVR